MVKLIGLMINLSVRFLCIGCALLLTSATSNRAFENFLHTQWKHQQEATVIHDADIESYYESEEPQERVVAPPDEYAEEPALPSEIPATPPQNPYAPYAPRGTPYKLAPGDVLLISVYGEERSVRSVEVSSAGTISYLFINALAVNGKTIPQLRQILEEKLTKLFKNPIVNITLMEGSPRFITILGEVWNPGRMMLLGDTTLLQAIAMAGGLRNKEYRGGLVDTSDFEHSFLARKGKYVPVDFRKLIVCGDTDEDIFLNPADFIYISRAITNRVFVLGEVRGPTVLNSMDSISLVEALTAAGGLGPRASSRLIVIRGSLSCPTRFLIDVNRVLKGYACDFPLCPGDIVYVPVRRFQRLREIIQGGISAFVSIVASVAGNEAFVGIVPKALGQTQQLLPTINAGGTTSFNFSQSASVNTSGGL